MFTRFTSFAAVLSALRRRRSFRSAATSRRFSLCGEPLEARLVPATVVVSDMNNNDTFENAQTLPDGKDFKITGGLEPGTDTNDYYAVAIHKGQTITWSIVSMGFDASYHVTAGLFKPSGDFVDLAPQSNGTKVSHKAEEDGIYRVLANLNHLAIPGFPAPQPYPGYELTIVVDGKDIQAKTLQWDTAKKGVTVSYENSVKLDKATKGGLYWATGTTADTIIDKSKPAYTFNLDKTAGAHEKTVALTSLKKPPTKNKGGVTEATHLLLILDPVSADKPQGVIVESDETNNFVSLTRKFDSDIFFAEVSKRLGKLSASQQEGLTYLIDKLVNDFNVIADPRQVAYILATAKWETAGTLKPIYEIPPKSIAGDAAKIEAYFNDKYSGRADLGNTEPTDGFTYRGRGYVQLTGRKNYRQIGDVVGVDLESDPDAALSPNTAYTIMTLGMQQGLFTDKSISDYITDDKTDYVNARRVINGTDKAGPISSLAKKFETILRNSVIPK